MQNYFNFSKKITLITGAVGEIGKSITEIFAENGSDLVLMDISKNSTELHEYADRIKKEYGVSVYVFEADIRQPDEIHKLELFFLEHRLSVDVLVNNAGVNMFVPAHILTEEQWDTVVDTNLKGTFFMSQVVGRNMITSGNGGSIISISSQHGIVGNVNRAPYCSSKAGMINLSKELSIEWAKHEIRVNCVSPTFVLHEKNKDLFYSSNMIRKELSLIPLGKYAVPRDIANAVLFLASPMASMITGHNLVVDGGYTAR